MAEDWKIDVGVPDVGDIVEYAGDQYRVDGWMRERHPPKPQNDTEFANLIDDILYETQQEIDGKKLQWCYRDEAQFVTLSGVGGTIAPITQVRVVGKVQWPQEHIDEARQQANMFAEKGEELY